MTTPDRIRALLLDAHPSPPDGVSGDWDDVLRRAGGEPSAARRTRARRRLAAVVTAVAAVVAVALLAPFETGQVDVLDRALAAVGDGPVLHAVLEQEWGGTLVDLESGERTELHGELELWYDPSRGLREISRFGGAVQSDSVRAARDLAAFQERTFGFLTDYRRTLESGTARVVGTDVVDGVPVHWIRIHDELLPDVADNRLHEWAHDIAVSRETFTPVATRETRDGVPGPQTGARILVMEALPEDPIDFPKRSRPNNGDAIGFGTSETVTLTKAASILGRVPLWLGEDFEGIPLRRVARLELMSRPAGTAEFDRESGVHLFYGSVDAKGFPHYSANGRYVVVEEVRRSHPAFRFGPRNYVVPQGKVLLTGMTAYLRKDGLFVSVQASSGTLALAAAGALAPVRHGTG